MSFAARQVLSIFACIAVLLALVGQLNHVLAPFALSLEVAGLLVAFAGLRLDFRRALAVALISGLWFDAGGSASFGRHAFLYALAVCMLSRVRMRLPRDEVWVGVTAALFINLGFFAINAFVALGSLPDPTAGGLRVLADLVISQLFIALIGPWFFACQVHALRLSGTSPTQVVRRYA